jgi:hypothetical protein
LAVQLLRHLLPRFRNRSGRIGEARLPLSAGPQNCAEAADLKLHAQPKKEKLTEASL